MGAPSTAAQRRAGRVTSGQRVAIPGPVFCQGVGSAVQADSRPQHDARRSAQRTVPLQVGSVTVVSISIPQRAAGSVSSLTIAVRVGSNQAMTAALAARWPRGRGRIAEEIPTAVLLCALCVLSGEQCRHCPSKTLAANSCQRNTFMSFLFFVVCAFRRGCVEAPNFAS
jgi:hypothetical protein